MEEKNVTNVGQQVQNTQTQVNSQVSNQYKPISAWGYVGWGILFSIPIIGLILIIVFACGAGDNINLRNYAKSKLCVLLICVIIFVIMFALAIMGFATFNSYR